MLKKTRQNKNVPELRQDLVTGEWVAIAEKRVERPQEFVKRDAELLNTSLKKCPFETSPQASAKDKPVLLYKNKNETDWTLQIVLNLYPIFTHIGQCKDIFQVGPYFAIEGAGLHEIVITRDHKRHLALMSNGEVTEVVRAYHQRYNEIKNDECVKYVSIFHNHGPEAGASISHPHSQIVATPVVPSDVHRSLEGSKSYEDKNKKCVHCIIIGWEKEDKKRILFENDSFIAFVPFVSRVNFEIQIFPKEHRSNFEETPKEQFSQLADVLRKSLRVLYDTLDNPSYNFFIHTAPADHGEHKHYHWHIEIFPKTNTWGGIELGTGMEVLMISPENAAKYLKKHI